VRLALDPAVVARRGHLVDIVTDGEMRRESYSARSPASTSNCCTGCPPNASTSG
jgi:hypothetical protein